MKTLVTGAGGMIGGHLVGFLLNKGHDVSAVDIKPFSEWFQRYECDNARLDLRKLKHCIKAVTGCDIVYDLACNMGGIGHIQTHHADCMLSVLINTHTLIASRRVGVKRYFFSSSACVYPTFKQAGTNVTALKESDAYPSMPESGYGEHKLFVERMCEYFRTDYGLETRIARFHNCYGTHGTYRGGREKAPAAICRKVIEAKLGGTNEIEIWGDGNQTRSFMWISDCLKGIDLIMNSRFHDPINLGSSELVSINQLVDIVEEVAGVKLKRNYNLDAPTGVNGRNSDNTLIKERYGWEPSTPLREGMEKLYEWVYDQIVRNHLDSAITK